MAFAPFGIAFGAPPPDGFDWLEDFYADGIPPAPHRDFEHYVCVAGSEGVGQVFATSASIDGDRLGVAARAAFDRVAAQLVSKYGDPFPVDHLPDHALWSEEHEWTDSIVHRERTYAAVWSSSENSLPPELEKISLGLTRHDDGGLKLLLCYTGTLYADIEAEIDAASADVL